jgi:hypothetical protein
MRASALYFKYVQLLKQAPHSTLLEPCSTRHPLYKMLYDSIASFHEARTFASRVHAVPRHPLPSEVAEPYAANG